MEPQTQQPDATADVSAQQANRLVVSNLFRAECHGTAARFFANVHVFVGALAAGLAAVSGGSAFTGNTTLAGALGLASAAFAGLLTALRPDERSQLHWNAAGAYFEQADDVYMSFRADEDGAGQQNDAVSRLRSFQEAFHRLETVGPPVPRRLERKTKQWVRDNQEWFPPQYDKFVEWWQEKQTGATVGPIRRFFQSIKRIW